MSFEVDNHKLVSKHIKLNDSERKELFEKYKVDTKYLPKILKDDSAIVNLKLKVGDIVKIERSSETAGYTVYYRVVIEE